MTCPNCGGSLQHHDLDGVKIDECDQCRGRWFDRDELRQAKDSQNPDIIWLDFDPFGDDAEGLSVTSEGKDCPKCSQQMKSLTYRESAIVRRWIQVRTNGLSAPMLSPLAEEHNRGGRNSRPASRNRQRG